MSDVVFLSATEQAGLIRDGSLSPLELVEEYLDRIDKLEPELNTFVTVRAEEALEDARRKQEEVAGGAPLPPFHGVPIPIKDLYEVSGVRTTFGSRALEDFVPDHDRFSVRRLKEAGFIILGKSQTPEFGILPVTESELNGICRNPWDPGRTPGGSSGGAAAAVAAGLAPVAHASDGAGSIRIPASCCGLFGLKPARGRISAGPMLGDIDGLSQQGSISRTVADTAGLLDVLAGYETGDPHWTPLPERPFAAEVGAEVGRLRIGVARTPPLDVPVDPDCSAALDDATRLFASLGHELEEVTPEWTDPQTFPAFTAVYPAGAAAFADVDVERIEPMSRVLGESARSISSIDFGRAMIFLQRLSRRLVSLWNDYDLLLTPTLALPPVPVGWVYDGADDPWQQFARLPLFVPYTPIANVTGQPAASLPTYWNDDGLPIGVQLIGRPAGEAELLRVAAQVEAARPWSHRRPPVS